MKETNKLTYEALNQAVCNQVSMEYLKILDIGCGSGEMGEYLKKQNSKRSVDGITYSENEYAIASQKLDRVVVQDLNNPLSKEVGDSYNCIICSHVLEHLYDPGKLLTELKAKLAPSGVLIVALPNILFFKQRMKFLLGKFKYSREGGLMDITHFRFYDWNSAEELIRECGFKIVVRKADGYFPLPLLRKIAPLARFLDGFALRRFPGLFGFQFILVAHT